MYQAESTMEAEEGRISIDGHHVWYRRVGSDGIPLLTLHGGPGAGHDYLEPLERLATDRAVILYDQLGCGKSDQPDDRSLWRLDRFVTEVDMVRRTLGLDHIYLFGHSGGGMLAIEYMLAHPSGVVSLILASTAASITQYEAEAARLRAALPSEINSTLQRYEAAGDYTHPDYENAVWEFNQRHFCRLPVPWPEALQRSGAIYANNPVRATMKGSTEFMITGTLKGWNRASRLREITVPTLITFGRYDSMTPACATTLHQGIPNSQVVIFTESAHVAHLEETERYLRAVSDFLATVEAQRQGATGGSAA
jgi:proline-specific peptidase